MHSGTPFSNTSNNGAAENAGEDGEDSDLPRRTRSRLGPLPKNGPDNPLFPPLPPKPPKPARTSVGGKSQSGGSRSGSMRRDEPEEGEVGDEGEVKEEPQQQQEEPAEPQVEETKQEDTTTTTTTTTTDTAADEWESYARDRRRARGFGAAGSSSARSRSSHSEKRVEVEEERKVTSAPASAVAQPEEQQNNEEASGEANQEEAAAEERQDIEEPSVAVAAADAEAQADADASAEETTSTTGRPTRSSRRSSKIDAPRPTSAAMATGGDSTGSLSALAEEEDDDDDDNELDGDAGDEEEDEDMEENADVTRCICGKEENDSAMMISCDQCNVWQHGPCVGIYSDEEAPDEYFCEICRPALHVCLRRYLKNLQKKGVHGFRAPTPQDLDNVHQSSDRVKPSQSLRWRAGFKAPPIATQKEQQSARSSSTRTRKESPPPSATGSDSRRASSRPSRSAQVQDSRYEPHGTAADRKKRPPIERRESSVLSETPPPPGSSSAAQAAAAAAAAAAKKRSTMNSRDAAYELAIAASLAEGGGEGSVAARGIKRARTEEHDDELDDAQVKKGKKPAREATTGTASAPEDGIVKPKHPNQYTYRPKPGDKVKEDVVVAAKKVATASPSKRATAAAAAATPAENHTTSRRAGISSARGGTPSGFNPFQNSLAVQNITWGMPDHLQPFSHLLPSPQPVPLEIVTPRPPKATLNHEPLAPGARPTHLEPPTKVRFPTKRMTVSEMRKRVRNVLEYVGRLQVEEVNRVERAKILGIHQAATAAAPSQEEQVVEATAEPKTGAGDAEDVDMDADAKDGEPAPEAPSVAAASADDPSTTEQATPDAPAPPKPASSVSSKSNGDSSTSKSMQLMDELTRDLIRFQEMFEPGYMGARVETEA